MEFEYNESKSNSNKEKHGIDFEEAKELWRGAYVEIEARTVGESRFMLIAKLKNQFYSCVFTKREEKIRIISCRKSRESEVKIYHEQIKGYEQQKED